MIDAHGTREPAALAQRFDAWLTEQYQQAVEVHSADSRRDDRAALAFSGPRWAAFLEVLNQWRALQREAAAALTAPSTQDVIARVRRHINRRRSVYHVNSQRNNELAQLEGCLREIEADPMNGVTVEAGTASLPHAAAPQEPPRDKAIREGRVPSGWPVNHIEPHAAAGTGLAETCLCAAVLFPDGYIVRGHRHDDCLITGGKMGRNMREAQQGFLTSAGRFVDRREGQQLQISAGIASADGGGYRGDILFSEDLY